MLESRAAQAVQAAQAARVRSDKKRQNLYSNKAHFGAPFF